MCRLYQYLGVASTWQSLLMRSEKYSQLTFTGVRGSRILGTPYTEPCIAHPYRTGAAQHCPVQVPNPKRHMLWCCIKMRDLACDHCGFTTVDMMVLSIVEMRGGGPVEQDMQARWGLRGKTVWDC